MCIRDSWQAASSSGVSGSMFAAPATLAFSSSTVAIPGIATVTAGLEDVYKRQGLDIVALARGVGVGAAGTAETAKATAAEQIAEDIAQAVSYTHL